MLRKGHIGQGVFFANFRGIDRGAVRRSHVVARFLIINPCRRELNIPPGSTAGHEVAGTLPLRRPARRPRLPSRERVPGMSDVDSLASATVVATGETCHSTRSSDSYAQDKAKLLARLRRIEGQVRGIGGMVQDDRYCIDVLTQISAVISSLQSVGLVMLEDHIRGCVVNADPEDREERLDELNKAIARFTRSVGG